MVGISWLPELLYNDAFIQRYVRNVLSMSLHDGGDVIAQNKV